MSAPLTAIGVEIDELARKRGGWADDVVVYALRVINDDQILMTGDVPTGTYKNGRIKWPRGKTAKPRFAAVSTKEYHATCDAAKAARVPTTPDIAS